MNKILTIECRDEERSLERLLRYIKNIAGIGHSFTVVVDPDDREHRRVFSIDGDGADKIFSIRVVDTLERFANVPSNENVVDT